MISPDQRKKLHEALDRFLDGTPTLHDELAFRLAGRVPDRIEVRESRAFLIVEAPDKSWSPPVEGPSGYTPAPRKSWKAYRKLRSGQEK